MSFFRVTFASQSRPFVGFQNFERMLTNDDFLESTLQHALLCHLFGVGLLHSLALPSRLLIRRITVGKDLLRLILIIPITMAPIVVGLMWNWMLDPLFGLVNWFLDLLGIPGQTMLAQAEHSALSRWCSLTFGNGIRSSS